MPLPTFGARRFPAIPAVSLGLALIAAGGPSRTAAAEATFHSACYSDNLTPGMAVGDFNHDGKLDVAINPGSQPVFPVFSATALIDVYLGNGDGTFSGPTELNAGIAYIDMAAGDLNHDGNLDLVTSQLSVFLGNGDGTFRGLQQYPGGATSGIALADFNRDGSLDVVVPGDKRNVNVCLNNGDGTLRAPIAYRTGNYNEAVLTGDFNGDGFADVVGLPPAGQPNGVSVLLGKGDGKFRDHLDTTLQGIPGRGLAAADFDRDGKLDLAVPIYDGALVLHGNGNGTFGTIDDYEMEGNGAHIDLADFNGDGNLDIVESNYQAFSPNPGGTVTILYGNGAGSFAVGTPITVTYGFGVLAGDANGDSRPDLFVDSCVLLNDGVTAAATASSRSATGEKIETARGVAFASPNPIRDRGRIVFRLARPAVVRVGLYDLGGRLVRTLQPSRWTEPGSVEVSFDRKGLAPGVYLYRVESTAGERASGRLVVTN